MCGAHELLKNKPSQAEATIQTYATYHAYPIHCDKPDPDHRYIFSQRALTRYHLILEIAGEIVLVYRHGLLSYVVEQPSAE